MSIFEVRTTFGINENGGTVANHSWECPSGSPPWSPPVYVGFKRVAWKREEDLIRKIQRFSVRDEQVLPGVT